MADITLLTGSGLFAAAAIGFLPALFWLWFWLREDAHPEPRSILILTFLYGMVAALAALVLELAVSSILSGITAMLIAWALIEETVKYSAAKRSALRKTVFDEPIDAVIYMITAALGFAAMENTLFLLKTITAAEGVLTSFITGNLRFIGATLLHTATSGVVGASIAYSFFHKEKRHRNVIGGIILASILHFIFNFYILRSEGVGILKVFIPLWVGIILIIFLFEKVKAIS